MKKMKTVTGQNVPNVVIHSITQLNGDLAEKGDMD
jgi:hypothetical protein